MGACAPTKDWHGMCKDGTHKSRGHESELCQLEIDAHYLCDTCSS
jgi:hypothetical protein